MTHQPTVLDGVAVRGCLICGTPTRHRWCPKCRRVIAELRDPGPEPQPEQEY